MKTVLGMDGSLQNFGLAVATVNEGEIKEVLNLTLSKTLKSSDYPRAIDDYMRFQKHWNNINELIVKYNITEGTAEIPSGSKDSRAAYAFGGVTAIYACLPIPVTLVTPSQVKVATYGNKHADKEDIIEWANKAFPLADWIKSKKPNKLNIKDSSGYYLTNANEHLADAIGTIQAGLKNGNHNN